MESETLRSSLEIFGTFVCLGGLYKLGQMIRIVKVLVHAIELQSRGELDIDHTKEVIYHTTKKHSLVKPLNAILKEMGYYGRSLAKFPPDSNKHT